MRSATQLFLMGVLSCFCGGMLVVVGTLDEVTSPPLRQFEAVRLLCIHFLMAQGGLFILLGALLRWLGVTYPRDHRRSGVSPAAETPRDATETHRRRRADAPGQRSIASGGGRTSGHGEGLADHLLAPRPRPDHPRW